MEHFHNMRHSNLKAKKEHDFILKVLVLSPDKLRNGSSVNNSSNGQFFLGKKWAKNTGTFSAKKNGQNLYFKRRKKRAISRFSFHFFL